MIPRIIHQMWNTPEVPPEFRVWIASWRRLHPEWDYRLWTDETCRQFVIEHFPDFLPTYDAYSYSIQRIDSVRYLILLVHGGVYIDLDFECFRSMDDLLESRTCVLSTEHPQHAVDHHKAYIISNAWMACVPQHPFMQAVLQDLMTAREINPNRELDILNSTGPFMMSRVYRRYTGDDVTLLPHKHLFPLAIREATLAMIRKPTPAATRALRKAHGVHYHAGTWWKPARCGS